MEANLLITAYRAKWEARAWRSSKTNEEINNLDEVPEHAITPLTEEHQAREEPVLYPLVIFIDSNTKVEDDPDEPESTDSNVA
ncbi:hypothetical protein TanjilG_10676 [Lupinus angustifolius]|uniref:Uncharacterized protein n=1 Tax=Lupinus angustifolius TaxID=3871 RepID=A0A1J7I131_LUPAN|nr:hypothetical protein TanjilG_10676 [Lupinus angustifolius]